MFMTQAWQCHLTRAAAAVRGKQRAPPAASQITMLSSYRLSHAAPAQLGRTGGASMLADGFASLLADAAILLPDDAAASAGAAAAEAARCGRRRGCRHGGRLSPSSGGPTLDELQKTAAAHALQPSVERCQCAIHPCQGRSSPPE